MTKAQLREKYINWNRDISNQYHDKQSEIFKELQELNATYGDGSRYCSAFDNFKHLIGTAKEYRAYSLFTQYYEISGKFEAMANFAAATENFNI